MDNHLQRLIMWLLIVVVGGGGVVWVILIFKNSNMKQDQKEVASKQNYEVYYISYHYNVSICDVKKAIKIGGRSRRKVYQALREMGYKIIVKK